MTRHTRSRLYTRRDILAAAAGLAIGSVLGPAAAQSAPGPVLRRAIPRTGEQLPVIGLGTAIVFDIGDDAAQRAERIEVLKNLFDGGARLIDTAPSYGTAEPVVGDLLANLQARDRTFLATKVRNAGRGRSPDAAMRQKMAAFIDGLG